MLCSCPLSTGRSCYRLLNRRASSDLGPCIPELPQSRLPMYHLPSSCLPRHDTPRTIIPSKRNRISTPAPRPSTTILILPLHHPRQTKASHPQKHLIILFATLASSRVLSPLPENLLPSPALASASYIHHLLHLKALHLHPVHHPPRPNPHINLAFPSPLFYFLYCAPSKAQR